MHLSVKHYKPLFSLPLFCFTTHALYIMSDNFFICGARMCPGVLYGYTRARNQLTIPIWH